MVSWKIMDTKTLNTYFHNKVLILKYYLDFYNCIASFSTFK